MYIIIYAKIDLQVHNQNRMDVIMYCGFKFKTIIDYWIMCTSVLTFFQTIPSETIQKYLVVFKKFLYSLK